MQLLLQGSVGLLGAGNVAGREALADLVEVLEQGILAGWIFACASGADTMVMTGVAGRWTALALEILLDGREILLRGGKVTGLEIGSELVEGLGDGVGGGGPGSGGGGTGASAGGGLREGLPAKWRNRIARPRDCRTGDPG